MLQASLDVKNLFSNVSVNFTFDLILTKNFSNGGKDFSGLNRQKIKKSSNSDVHAKKQYFNLGEHLRQTEGIAMGSPIASSMVDVCMNWVLNKVHQTVGEN